MRVIKKNIKEPLVHFIIIGALVFAFYSFIKGSYVDENYAIQITKSEVEGMLNKWMAQMKRPLAIDVKNFTWTNTIGSAELITIWKDPDLKAFYYVRVIEIPTQDGMHSMKSIMV